MTGLPIQPLRSTIGAFSRQLELDRDNVSFAPFENGVTAMITDEITVIIQNKTFKRNTKTRQREPKNYGNFRGRLKNTDVRSPSLL